MKKKCYNPSGEMPVYGNTGSQSQNALPIPGSKAVLSMPSSKAASGKPSRRLPILARGPGKRTFRQFLRPPSPILGISPSPILRMPPSPKLVIHPIFFRRIFAPEFKAY